LQEDLNNFFFFQIQDVMGRIAMKGPKTVACQGFEEAQGRWG
jgi:hypothetical protein